MAKINITQAGGRYSLLCSTCKETAGEDTMPAIVEAAQYHLRTMHSSKRTHRVEMDMDHLSALTGTV